MQDLLIAFRYLLDKEDFKSLKKELTKLLNSFSTTTSVSQKNKLLEAKAVRGHTCIAGGLLKDCYTKKVPPYIT